MSSTVMILNFLTDWYGQTEEQSNQGPHCLPFHLHLLDKLSYDLDSALILGWLQQKFSSI